MNSGSWTIFWCFCVYAAFGILFGYSYQRRKGGAFISGFLAGIIGPLGWLAIALSTSNLRSPEEKAAAREKAAKNVKNAFVILGSAAFVLFVVLAVSSGQLNTTNNLYPNSPSSVPANAPTPTSTFAKFPVKVTVTSLPAVPVPFVTSTSECLDWRLVNLTYVGSRLCVTGTVYSATDDGVAWYVKFKSDYTSFYFVSYAWFLPDVKAGSVVSGRGIVKQIGNAPVILLDEMQRSDFHILR